MHSSLPGLTAAMHYSTASQKVNCKNCKRVQNAAARLVTNTRKYAHITPVLKSLHWLPVEQRLMYKILLITFRALKFSSPQYINSLIEIYKPSRSGLRSSAEFSLAIPKSKRTWGIEHLHQQLLTLWNSLPKSIHLSESVDIFKSKLKTHLMEGIFLE